MIRSIHDLPPDHEVHALLKAHNDALRVASFGCEFLEMGASEQDDHVLYAAITASKSSCGSEDDHGGFGEEVIPAEKLVAGADWDDLLAKFCAYVGVPAELVKPRWTLSMNG